MSSFETKIESLDKLFIALGYIGEFQLGSDIQAAVNKHLVTLEHGIGKIWPKDEDGLEILDLFQRDNLLRDLRDLAVLSPPVQPKTFLNFKIFE